MLHIRNLPPDATEEDVLELCTPFGRVIKTKMCVGQAKAHFNQAFAEFDNINSTISMIMNYVGGADPPKVRVACVHECASEEGAC